MEVISIAHHNFSSRLNRSASELLILTIIESKGKAHPYEIYKTLLHEIFYKKYAEIQKSSQMISFSKKYIKFLEDSTVENENVLKKEIQELLPDGMTSDDFVLTKRNANQYNNKKNIENLGRLLNEAEGFVKSQKEKLKIWKSKTAIYQVMKDLEEKEKLITVVNTEIISGRSRKIYSITDKGRETAIKWILEFGDLYDRISPKISQFTGIENAITKNHRLRVLSFMEQFIPVDSIIKFLLDDSGSPFSQLVKSFFPIVGNPSKVKTLLLSDEFQFDFPAGDLIPKKYKAVYKELLLKHMKEFKNKIENKIRNLEKE